MLSAYGPLPKSIKAGGKSYPINTVYHAAITVFALWNDPELDDEYKTLGMLDIICPSWHDIPDRHLAEAVDNIVHYLDCGQKDDGKDNPKLIDWELDAPLIIPAVNSVAHGDIRAMPDLHWWTFFSWFMEIRESVFSSVLAIRQKKAKHKKLEDYEKEFYRENRALIDMKEPESEEIRAEKDSILKYL